MARVFLPADRVERLPGSAENIVGPRVADAMRQCLPALAFVAAWVCAGTVLLALLTLFGRGLMR